MRDKIRALLLKTVKNGATKEEEQSARRMAEALCLKHGIALSSVKAEVEDPNFGASVNTRLRRQMREGQPVRERDLNDIIRDFHRARAEQERRERERGSAVRAEAAERAKRYAEADLKKEAAKARHAEAEKRGSGFNPFGVHGKGEDFKGEFESVRHFVEWSLRNTERSYDTIAKASVKRFGGKTSVNSVAWYASKLRAAGIKVTAKRRIK